ncbi:MAG TPA: hypothetical protein VI076_16775 [Actinopolymorphaceae bacterium]
MSYASWTSVPPRSASAASSPPEAAVRPVRRLDEEYGSVERYLVTGGATLERLRALRTRLRTTG